MFRSTISVALAAAFALLACETEPEDLFPSFPEGHGLTLNPGEKYTVGERVDATLPAAQGGNAPLAHGLTPSPPSGLAFDAAARTISGTPTTMKSHTTYSYKVTDADGDSDTIAFGITVVRGTSGACRVGQVLSPGDSCTVGSEVFKVLSDGTGQYGCCINVGEGISINGFVAKRISGTKNWRIHEMP